MATHKSGAQAFYQAGKLAATGSVAETPAIRGDKSNSSNGGWYLLAFWNRVLTPEESQELSANPWRLFAPVVHRYGFASAAASSGIPFLSLAGASSITSSMATPFVTVTF